MTDPLRAARARAEARRTALAALDKAGFVECALADLSAGPDAARTLLALAPRSASLPLRLVAACDPPLSTRSADLLAVVAHDGKSPGLELELASLAMSTLRSLGAKDLSLTWRTLIAARAVADAAGLDAATRERILEEGPTPRPSLSREAGEGRGGGPPSPTLPPQAEGGGPDPAQLEHVLLGLLGRLKLKTYGTRSPEEVAARLAARLTQTLPVVAQKIQAVRGTLRELAPEAPPEETIARIERLVPAAAPALREMLDDLARLGAKPARVELATPPGLDRCDPAWSIDNSGGALGWGGSFEANGLRAGCALLRLDAVLKEHDLPHVQVLVVPVAREQLATAHTFAEEVRRAGLRAELDPSGRNLRSALRAASRRGIPLVAIVGEKEQQEGTVLVKDLAREQQESHPRAGAIDAIRGALGRERRARAPDTGAPSDDLPREVSA